MSGACGIVWSVTIPRADIVSYRIIIAPDSFKGCLSAADVADAIARGIRQRLPDAAITTFPLADGGEGTLACVAHARTAVERWNTVAGADDQAIRAPWLLLDDATAVLETAQVAGLPAACIPGFAPPEARSSRGLGEQISRALDAGARRIIIGLGGSSTNDGGAGLLAALGARLTDAGGADIPPTPRGLESLARVDLDTLDPRLRTCELIGLSDVDNPLTGARGATAVYGPQKGIAAADVEALDSILARFAAACERVLGQDFSHETGAGAAGGLGFALLCLGGRLAPGAGFLTDLTGLPDAIPGASLVITGEGRSDTQTLQGQLPAAVARHARAAGVPVVLLAGALDADARESLHTCFDACFSIAAGPAGLDEMCANSDRLLSFAGAEIAGLLRAFAHDA